MLCQSRIRLLAMVCSVIRSHHAIGSQARSVILLTQLANQVKISTKRALVSSTASRPIQTLTSNVGPPSSCYELGGGHTGLKAQDTL